MARAIFFKQIKAKPFQSQAFWRLVNAAMNEISRGVKDDFEKTTTTWSHAVTFTPKVMVNSRQAVARVFTTDQIYRWVNHGTGSAAHGGPWYPIYPRNKKRLAYPVNFSPKTSPGVLDSVQGGKSGPITHRAYVYHPGVTPRKFDHALFVKWTPIFFTKMVGVVRDFAHASGHGVTR